MQVWDLNPNFLLLELMSMHHMVLASDGPEFLSRSLKLTLAFYINNALS